MSGGAMLPAGPKAAAVPAVPGSTICCGLVVVRDLDFVVGLVVAVAVDLVWVLVLVVVCWCCINRLTAE